MVEFADAWSGLPSTPTSSRVADMIAWSWCGLLKPI
jgi:hypothetical protein